MQIPVKDPCEVLVYPDPSTYEKEAQRRFQGCPTVAVTPKGRIFMGWYSGGWMEPHIDNYNLLVSSEDGGLTWSDPLLIIPSDKERLIHALDIQLWIDPLGPSLGFLGTGAGEKAFSSKGRLSGGRLQLYPGQASRDVGRLL